MMNKKEDILETFLYNISYKFPKGYPDMNDKNDVYILENEFKKIGINTKKLSEVQLSPTQLEKPYPQRDKNFGKYDDRGERFLEMIIKNEPLTLNDGSDVIIDNEKSKEGIEILKSKDYSKLGLGKKLFYDKEGNLYSLSNFKKTEEFGSGKGFGGGSINTDIQESSQCIINEIAFKIIKSNIDESHITEDNIRNAYKYVDISSDLESCLEFILNQDSWKNTFISTANILEINYSNSLYSHRGSEFTKKIYDAFKIAKKKEGLSLSNDKWNPADIWLVDKSIYNIEFKTDINELNLQLLELYKENKLIGVSLKKISKDASLSVYNEEESNNTNKIEDYISSDKSKDSYIIYNNGKISFRTFNFATNFAGEIKGKTASHGKIGQGAINRILQVQGLPLLEKPSDIKDEVDDDNFIDNFYIYYNSITKNLSEDDFMEILNESNLDWKISKYLANKLLYIIKNTNDEIRDNVINQILSYSSSQTSDSSVFIKIS